MSKISRRKFVTAGFAATAGVSGLGVAVNLAKRYGFVPPDSGGVYGPGETLTYAAQRLFARHSLAREFPRSMISKVPFANEIPPLNEAFKRLQGGDFADWRLSIDGMVARPASHSLADLRSFPVRSQITEVVCEEGWSYVAEWTGTPLFDVLKASGILPQARYLVYFSIDPDWWESIDRASNRTQVISQVFMPRWWPNRFLRCSGSRESIYFDTLEGRKTFRRRTTENASSFPLPQLALLAVLLK